MSDQTERDFIFGILAAQLGLVAPRQVVAAAAAWLADRTRSIPQRLLAEGLIDQQKFRQLEAMADQVLAAEGGDVMETIAQTDTAPTDTAQTLRASSPSAPSPSGPEGTDDATLLDERRGAVVSTEGITGVTPESPARYSFLGGARESAIVGKGGLGKVMIAFDEHLGRRVAVKELLSDVRDTAGAIVRLLKEARVTAQLEHPNIVPVYEIGKRLDGSLYYTMKLVQGRTLAAALKACTSLDERLKLLPHFVALCNAIAYAHSRGVIHRDVKTENVMVGEFGETVVLDWGVAKARGKKEEAEGAGLTSVSSLIPDGGAGSTVEGAAIGTPSYMSPEQAMGKIDEVDEQSDVWSLGAVLYEILTGRPPFTGKTTMQVLSRVMTEPVVPPRRIDEAIPPELASICEKALSRGKTSRYRSAREIADEIEAFRSGARVRFHEYSSMELFRRFAAKNKAALMAACAILAVIVAALVMVSLSFRSEKSARQHEHEALEKEKREHLIANFHIAQAFNEKADRLEKEKRSLESRIYAAASLLHNPSNPQSPYASPTFARLFPESDLLNVEAASIIYRSSLGLVLSYGGSFKSDDAFSDVAFSPDGKLVAACGFDRKVGVWDVETEAIVLTLEGHTDSVSDATFSPDGRWLASASADRTVRLWDLKEGRALLTLQACENKVQCAAFSADGARVAAGCSEGKITVWDAATGAPLLSLSGHEGQVMGVAFSPDGKTIASGSYDKTVRTWDAATGAPVAVLAGQGKRVTDVAFSPDGKLILAGAGDKTVRVWDVESGKQVVSVEGHRDLVMGVDFSPDGRTLASAGYDGAVKLWRLDATRPILALDGHKDWIFGVAFSPDGKRLASASLDKTLKVWDVSTGKLVLSIEGQLGFMWHVDYSPDGLRLAAGCADGTVGLWDAKTGQPIHAMKGHVEVVHCVDFSPDGSLITSAGEDRTVRLWDTASGQQVAVLEGHEGKVWEAVFSPDGKFIASASSDNTVRLWDVEGRKLVRTFPHAQWVTSVDFSPDGKTIAAAGKDGTAVLWDASTGKKIKVLLGHEQWVNTVMFSPDGKHIATASDDGRFGIWSVDTGKLILVINVVESGADSALSFSPDGQWLATDQDKSILVFPLDFSILAPHPQKILDEAQTSSGMVLDGFELKMKE
jgi:WD40 repeat protein/serine/threonine protein kinase